MKESKEFYREKIKEMYQEHDLKFKKNIWNGKVTKPVVNNYKISLCTTCMDRLFDLKKTLPKNMEDNKEYTNLEFVILDYNSKDGLEKWVKENLMEHIQSGRLVYYRTETPKFYSMTKSRNLAFKAASGDIINNVDADNYVHSGFAEYLNVIANQFTEKVIFSKGLRMIRGRLGFWKNEFIDTLKGYDESIEDYGRDDHDLLNRALMAGFTLAQYGGKYFDKTNTPANKTKNMKTKDWKLSELRNELHMLDGIAKRKVEGNISEWGQDILIKNFKEEIVLA